MAFIASLRIPLKLYAGDDAREINAPLAAKAQQLGKDCELVVVRGNHQAMVAPAVQQVIVWFRQRAVKQLGPPRSYNAEERLLISTPLLNEDRLCDGS